MSRKKIKRRTFKRQWKWRIQVLDPDGYSPPERKLNYGERAADLAIKLIREYCKATGVGLSEVGIKNDVDEEQTNKELLELMNKGAIKIIVNPAMAKDIDKIWPLDTK